MKTVSVSVTLLLAACGGPVGIVRGDLSGETGLVASIERASITGRVVDSRGEGVPMAVVITDPRGFEAQADSEGAFVFPWLPAGELELVATSPGFVSLRSGAVVLEEGEKLEMDLVLDAPSSGSLVTVTVTGPDGRPVPGAVVTASDGTVSVADPDGVASLEGWTAEGAELTVSDADGDLWSRSLRDVTVAPGGGLQWSPQLSGRPDGEVSFYGRDWCALCHEELVDEYMESAHGRAFLREPDGVLADALAVGIGAALGDASIELWLDGEVVMASLMDSRGEQLTMEVEGFLGDPDSSSVPVVDLGEQRYPLPVAWRAGSEGRAGFPCEAPGLVGFETDRWLDEAGQFDLDGDAPDPASSAQARCLPCHVGGYELTQREDGGVDLLSEDGAWLDDGVDCERCHGPGESHLYSMAAADIVQPGLLDAERADEVCGQCHGRREGSESGLPHPFGEPRPYQAGERLADTTHSVGESWGSGAAALARMQHDEHMVSGHGPTGAGLRCVDCHQVHGEHGATRPGLLRASVEDNALCEGCHLRSSFGGDSWAIAEHMGHRFYDPGGAQEAGRCVHCHMPATATAAGWCELTGSGSLSSHLFTALAPQHTVEVFHDEGLEALALGAAPAHACGDCHAWNAWYFESLGLVFRGPSGDPTLLETHEAHQAAYEEIYP
jgi:predicted CXXCH cytochrome family protein